MLRTFLHKEKNLIEIGKLKKNEGIEFSLNRIIIVEPHKLTVIAKKYIYTKAVVITTAV